MKKMGNMRKSDKTDATLCHSCEHLGSKHLLGQLLGHDSCLGTEPQKIPVTLNFKHSPYIFFPDFVLKSVMLTMTWLSVAAVTTAWTSCSWQVCSDQTTQELHKDGTDGLQQSFSSSTDRALCGNALFLLAGWAWSKVPHLYLPVLINDISSLPCSLLFFSPPNLLSVFLSHAHFNTDTPSWYKPDLLIIHRQCF